MPTYGLPIISTAIVALGYLCTLCCAYHITSDNTVRCNKSLILLYCVYTLFVLFQLFISPTLNLNDLSSVPDNLSSYIISSVILFFMMQSVGALKESLNFTLFAKLSAIIILLFLIAYNFRIGFEWYGLFYGMRVSDIENIVPLGYIDGLSMNNFVGLLFVCNLYLHDKWTEKKLFNIIITAVVGLLCFVVQFIMIERGPVLFQLVTICIFIYAKNIISKKNMLSIVVVIVMLLLFSESILERLSILSPEMIDKISNTSDGGGSGRFGSDDSVYAYAVKQILENPLFGSHCRFTVSTWLGSYPHNLILELLMTFGIMFSVPTFFLLWKALKNAFQMLKENTPDSLFAIMFIFTTLCLQTSGSLLGHINFWLSFAYVITYSKYSLNSLQYGK